jgi:hypothetical protein
MAHSSRAAKAGVDSLMDCAISRSFGRVWSHRLVPIVFLLTVSVPVSSSGADSPSTSPPATPAEKAPHDSDRMALFKDPKDGHFDTSRWLLDHRGFLPVPIVITDPAVGTGGGVALTFFHRPKGAATTRKTRDGHTRMITPNLYGVGAIRTSDGTSGYGAGASMHFDEDRWRYRGGLAKADINLDVYTPGALLQPIQIGYNVDGIVSFQQGFRRLGDQDLYLGLAWTYTDLDISFDSQSDRNLFTDRELAQRSSGLGLSLEYDSRDNPFTPNSGWIGMIEGNFYDGAIGSDNDFQSYRAHSYVYVPVADKRLIIGGRVDLRAANGDVPFYRLPYIDLRGIGSLRYQGQRVATVETEWRWNVTQRWALIGFAGAGRAWGRRNDFGDAPSRVSKGTGLRYLLARQLGMYVGLDYAWGPEDETFYVQIGSAWR